MLASASSGGAPTTPTRPTSKSMAEGWAGLLAHPIYYERDQMNIKTLSCALVSVFGLGLVACDNVGNAPSGKSADEMKSYVDQQKPEDQIKMWQASPAPPAEKAKKIAEIRKKYNLPDPAENGGAAGPGGQFPGGPRSGG